MQRPPCSCCCDLLEINTPTCARSLLGEHTPHTEQALLSSLEFDTGYKQAQNLLHQVQPAAVTNSKPPLKWFRKNPTAVELIPFFSPPKLLFGICTSLPKSHFVTLSHCLWPYIIFLLGINTVLKVKGWGFFTTTASSVFLIYRLRHHL